MDLAWLPRKSLVAASFDVKVLYLGQSMCCVIEDQYATMVPFIAWIAVSWISESMSASSVWRPKEVMLAT